MGFGRRIPRRAPPKGDTQGALIDALTLSSVAIRQLEWAESKRNWFYFSALVRLIQALGGKIMKAEEGGYLVTYDYGDPSDGA